MATQHQEYSRLRSDYTCSQYKLKSIQLQSYSTLFENPKLDVNVQILESILSQLKNSNFFLFFVWKYKQTIYIFQRLVKVVRIDGFKLEGGELFKEGFRKLFKQEWNYLKKQLIQKFSSPKQQAKAEVPEKTISCFVETIGCLYQQTKKTEFKELEIERLYTIVYTGSLQTQSYIQPSHNPEEIH